MKTYLLAIAALINPLAAHASSSQLGSVSNTIVNRPGNFFFDHSGGRDARPACGIYNRWVIDATTAQGQAMMSLVLTAQAQNKPIIVHGLGRCIESSDTEAIDHVIVP